MSLPIYSVTCTVIMVADLLKSCLVSITIFRSRVFESQVIELSTCAVPIYTGQSLFIYNAIRCTPLHYLASIKLWTEVIWMGTCWCISFPEACRYLDDGSGLRNQSKCNANRLTFAVACSASQPWREKNPYHLLRHDNVMPLPSNAIHDLPLHQIFASLLIENVIAVSDILF